MLELLAFELPLSLFLDLLVKFVLLLSVCVHFLILVLEDLVESQQFLVEQCQFILMVVDEILVVSEFHDGYLILLAFLLVVIDLSIAILK